MKALKTGYGFISSAWSYATDGGAVGVYPMNIILPKNSLPILCSLTPNKFLLNQNVILGGNVSISFGYNSPDYDNIYSYEYAGSGSGGTSFVQFNSFPFDFVDDSDSILIQQDEPLFFKISLNPLPNIAGAGFTFSCLYFTSQNS